MRLRPAARPPASASAGFTLIELLIAISMLAVLLSLAAPSLATWIRNTQIRTVSETLQNGLRTAQAEKTAIGSQLERARKRFEVGMSPILDVQNKLHHS